MASISFTFFILLLIGICSANVAPQPTLKGKIANGVPATPFQFRFMALLIGEDSITGLMTGSGSIISSTYILSSAQFTFGKDYIDVYAGRIVYGQGILCRVTQELIKYHDDLDRTTSANDIVLIRVPYIEFNNAIEAIRLPRINGRYSANMYVNDRVFLAGWGSTSNNSPEDHATQLRFIEQAIIPNIQCDAHHEFVNVKKLCIETPGLKSPCKGDYGGPLIKDMNSVHGPLLVGVLSAFHPQGCEKGYPVVYTRIDSYLKWIRDNSGVQHVGYN